MRRRPVLEALTSFRWISPTVLVGGTIVLIVVSMAIFAPWLTTYDPIALSSDTSTPPSREHIFGTDSLGRDTMSRVVYGARSSLVVAFIAVMISIAIGVPLGTFVPFIGGNLDRALSIPIDALYAFPSLILALVISFIIGKGAINTGIAIAFSWIPLSYKVVRSITLSIKETLLVESEKSLGASGIYIVFRHVIPRTVPTLLVLISLTLGRTVLAVASLGFLGFGVQPPTPEWGTDLSAGRNGLLAGVWWPVFFPGIMIFIMVLGFNLLSEGLNEILNQKLKVTKYI